MYYLFLTIICIISSLDYSASDTKAINVENIDCMKTFNDIASGKCEKVFRVRCNNICLDNENPVVYGTVRYSPDSVICKSAIHDLRISTWNDSMKTLSFQCSKLKNKITLKESLRQKIQSKGKRTSSVYKFTSPRISEEILDVISLHYKYMFQDKEEPKQECRIATKTKRDISFNPYNRKNVRNPKPQEKGSYSFYSQIWRKYPEVRAFWCRPINNMLSGILSPTMRKDADFRPAQLTETASVGDTVILKMDSLFNSSDIRWYRDDKRLSGNKLERNFENVEIGDAALYTLIGENSKKAGVIRLIVRVCKSDTYGPSCEHSCPTCLNGGICHDITGECICPPGFNGSDCGNGCGKDLFGSDCTQRCFNEDGDSIPCKEILFCLPDPYGCSCISGFHTIYCNTSCEAGKYGAGCTQICSMHCNTTLQEVCDSHSGKCPSGCEEGWHGDTCFLSYPVLKDPPTINTTNSHSIIISFNEWKSGVDLGVGQIVSYIVQYKNSEDDGEKWINGKVLNANEANNEGKYFTTVENLQPDSDYSVRVIAVDKSGSNQSNDVREAPTHTKCGVPQQPPVDISIDSSLLRMISVNWKLPSNYTWQCSNVTVTLLYTIESIPETMERLWQNEFSFNIEPYTNFSVKLRTVNKDGMYSNWSAVYENISAEDAPSPVENILYKYNFQQIVLTWNKPLKENGIIRMYSIEYQQNRWLHQCDVINSTIRKFSVNDTTANIDVYPSAVYKVNISAVTVKQGNWSEIDASSKEEVPDGPPTNLRISSVTSNKLSIEWEKPACHLANGIINKYSYNLSALEDWDKTEYSGVLSESNIEIEELIPFTTYTFQVFAGTSVGFSNHSANITATTSSERPPSPSDLIIYHRTASLLSLSWKPPYPPKGLLEKYEIVYSCSNVCNKIEKSVEINSVKCPEGKQEDRHCYLLSDLKANKNYSIKIWAYNKGIAQSGDYAQVYGETMESVPDPPSEAVLINRTETSLDIAWKAPVIINGNLTEYRINITAAESYNKTVIGRKQSETTNAKTFSFCFEDLHPATTYSVTIEARTAVGYGLPLFDLFTTRQSVPIIDFEPKVIHKTKSTIELQIKPISFTGGPISGYFIIVRESKRRKKREVEEIQLINYNTSVENGIDYYMAANLISEEINSSGINFTVGDGNIYRGFYNAPLVTGNEYMLGIAVLSNYSGEQRIGHRFLSRAIRVEYLKKDERNITGPVIGILFAIVVFFIVILAIIAYRNPEWIRKVRRQSILNKNRSPIDKELINMSMDTLNVATEKEIASEEERYYIPVSRLEEYVEGALESGLLHEEFMFVEKGQFHSWNISKLPENRAKNRYGNLLAYDHTRVVLTKIPNNPCSDYINANFVDGYRKPKKYIATQGPKPTTVFDFWRMIWQERVCKIIMCTNLVEGGKIKCEKYWPDNVETYGSFQISLKHTEMFADYVIRTLNVTYEGETREIKHFHFTTWPDHGVPMYAITVANFMQKARIYQPDSSFPIVIHCSAGIGRTGTLILIDSMLDMAAAEQSVQLTSHLRNMRDQRINLLENLDQYSLVYHALIDALCIKRTAILCADYISSLTKMKEIDPVTGKTAFFEQFQQLSKICPLVKTVDTCIGLDPTNRCKNRNMDIIPLDHARPILVAPRESPNSTYINAVFINGYRKKDAFIVTQIPLPETIADFWNMLYNSETNAIVLLNMLEPTDETSPQYWPDTSMKFYDIEVNNIGIETFGDIAIRTFELRKKKEETPKVIKQFHLTNWHPSDLLPPSDDILYLMEKVERWQQQNRAKAVVVQCLNGVRACGIYCTAVFICDKMKAEQEVDVFLAVKCIRSNRPEFIESEEQYIYCHQIALKFLDSFEIYANFQ